MIALGRAGIVLGVDLRYVAVRGGSSRVDVDRISSRYSRRRRTRCPTLISYTRKYERTRAGSYALPTVSSDREVSLDLP